MRTRLEAVRITVSAWIVLMAVVVSVPAAAQKLGPDRAPDPDASVVNEQTLLQHAPRIEGRISISDWRASVLVQPAGREWVTFHEVILHWLGAIAILGMIWPWAPPISSWVGSEFRPDAPARRCAA